MPINPPPLSRLTKAQFRELDFAVMPHVFASHNELGRSGDERIYQSDLAARLNAADLRTQRETPIRVTHGTFFKPRRRRR